MYTRIVINNHFPQGESGGLVRYLVVVIVIMMVLVLMVLVLVTLVLVVLVVEMMMSPMQ